MGTTKASRTSKTCRSTFKKKSDPIMHIPEIVKRWWFRILRWSRQWNTPIPQETQGTTHTGTIQFMELIDELWCPIPNFWPVLSSNLKFNMWTQVITPTWEDFNLNMSSLRQRRRFWLTIWLSGTLWEDQESFLEEIFIISKTEIKLFKACTLCYVYIFIFSKIL